MNRVFLQATKFTDVPQGTETLGWRMSDDHLQSYGNTWDSIPDNDLDLLAKVIDDKNADDLLDFCFVTKQGIEINGTYYEFDKIKHLWERG